MLNFLLKRQLPASSGGLVTDHFEPPAPLQTAVLFLVFNRPDTTAQVFEAIRRARPPRLYVAADGPRENREDEVERVDKVRKIATAVDWPCEVKTLFREKNLGCKYAVSRGITWFFEHEEQGIILEDDCFSSQSFFWFCEELLTKFKHDTRVGQICGFNPLNKFDFNGMSYGFSKFGPVWGWASWRRAWSYYDVNMNSWDEVKNKNYIDFFTDSNKEKRWRLKLFSETYNKKIDTWDYQWSYAKLIQSQLSVIPHVNMIKNIGFGDDATHTTGNIPDKLLLSYELIERKILHEKYILRNKQFDGLYLKNFVKYTRLGALKNRLRKTIKAVINKVFR